MAFAVMKNKARTWELLQLINPIYHGNTPEAIAKYKVEPYVMAADIYKQPLNNGRGGWTWYTGSAGWMYQLIIDSFLGFKKQGNILTFAPCVPPEWHQFTIDYNFEDTTYNFTFIQNENEQVVKVTLDGVPQPTPAIALVNDEKVHVVKVFFGDKGG